MTIPGRATSPARPITSRNFIASLAAAFTAVFLVRGAGLDETRPARGAESDLVSEHGHILIQVRATRVSEADFRELGFEWFLDEVSIPDGNEDREVPAISHPPLPPPVVSAKAGILNERQLASLLEVLESRPEILMFKGPPIRATSGMRVQLDPPRRDYHRRFWGATDEHGRIELPMGVHLDAIPRALPDGTGVALPISMKFAELLGFEELFTPPPASMSARDREPFPILESIRIRFHVRAISLDASVSSGGTLVISLMEPQDLPRVDEHRIREIGRGNVLPFLRRFSSRGIVTPETQHLFLISVQLVDP